MEMINILAIPGSLRENSSSYKILEVLKSHSPASIRLNIFKGICDLPHFNDPTTAPLIVQSFLQEISTADGLLFCTPEYAFGIPGALKNAIDWTVGTAVMINKPVALITASSSGRHAHEAMLLVLKAISAQLVDDGALLLSFIRSAFSKEGELKDDVVLEKILHVLQRLSDHIIDNHRDAVF